MEKIEDFLKYELATFPTALFDDSCMMREVKKEIIAEHLWKKVPYCSYVLDGGALLHKLGDAFAGIIDQTVQHVKTIYKHSNTKDVTVVFHHNGGPSMKDHTHIRRTGGVQGVTINFMLKTMFCTNKKTFMPNHFNSQTFINMLSSKLVENEIFVKHLSGGAVYLIALTATETVKNNNVAWITDDTDILVILLDYAQKTPFNRYLEASSSNATRPEWNIFELYNMLGAPITSSLLCAHAFLGGDTVSSIFNKGYYLANFTKLEIS